MITQETQVKDFENVSPFQGVYEFRANDVDYRFMANGFNLWNAYEKSGSSFIHSCVIRSKATTLKGVYNSYIRYLDH